jgi:hypothetical protein
MRAKAERCPSAPLWRRRNQWLLASLCAATVSVAVASPLPADDLYRARAFVTGQDEADRGRGFALCLEDVLVKLSGDPSLIGDARLAALQARAADFVADFRYQDRMAGIPVHDEQGTRERPYDLYVSFDHAAIDAALRTLGREPWRARPRIAMLLGVQDARANYVLASDGDRGLGQRQSLAEAAARRGLPLVLPGSLVLDRHRLTYSRLAAGEEPPLAAAKDAGGDVALVGTLVWSEPLLGWVADWRLNWQGKPHHWQIRGVSFDDAFRNAVDGAELILSGHGEAR